MRRRSRKAKIVEDEETDNNSHQALFLRGVNRRRVGGRGEQ